MFKYGMLYRGFSPACQPMQGLIERQDDTSGKYFDILVYDRKLTENEVKNYELEEITMAEEQKPEEQKPKKKRDRTEYMKQYYQKRREELREKHREWSKNHPEENKRSTYAARAKKRLSKTPGELLDALDAIKPESE